MTSRQDRPRVRQDDAPFGDIDSEEPPTPLPRRRAVVSHRGRRRGRPPLLTKDVEERLLQTIKAGATVRDAAEYHGIPSVTVREWIARGQGHHQRPATPLYRDFAAKVTQARAAARVAVVGVLRSRMPRDTGAALAWLARHDPEVWGRPRRAARGAAEPPTPLPGSQRMVIISAREAAAIGLGSLGTRTVRPGEGAVAERETLAVESYGPDDPRPGDD